ncbi:MAG: hypothetical protein QW775_07400 [Ignisphaera sp.]
MKILHVNNIAGVASTISHELRNRGIISDVLIFDENPYSFPYDYKITGNRFMKLLKTMLKGFKYDIIHWHYPKQRKTISIYSKIKPVIKHYHGTDLRGKFEEAFCIVSTPDLLEYAPNSIYIPNPVDIEKIKPVYRTKNPKPIITYYCSAISKIEIVKEAKSKIGDKYQFIELKGYRHEDALNLLANSDLFIDIRSNSWYGVTSIEAMALGKPVIGDIKDEFRMEYNPPIIQYNYYKNLTNTINEILNNENLRIKYAINSRNYIEKTHNIKTVINELIKIYSKLY